MLVVRSWRKDWCQEELGVGVLAGDFAVVITFIRSLIHS